MRLLKISFCLFITLIFSGKLLGQSLYKDSKALAHLKSQLVEIHREVASLELEQVRVNSQSTDAPSSITKLSNIRKRLSVSRDSSIWLSGEILAILEHYWERPNDSNENQIEALRDKLWKNYDENQSLAPVLASIRLVIDTSGGTLQQAYLARRDSLRSSVKREKIISLLNSQYAQSPLEYLSVSRTLKDYQKPPLSSIEFMQASAEASNKNINKGVFNQQAIIIGLFNFLMERAQEEVVITFLERLLGKNGIKQFRELFPSTSSAFGDLEFTYSESFLERLRDAFYKDIQLLSVSLPSLLMNEDYFQLLDSDPIAYNFLQLYSMVGMGQQGVPLTEIVPLTFRNLYDRYEDERKAINLKIAEEYHTYEEYKILSGTIDGILKQIVEITGTLDRFQQETMEEFSKLKLGPLKILEEDKDTITSKIITVESGDSTVVDTTKVIVKIDINGNLTDQSEDRKDAFFNLFPKEQQSASTNIVEAPIDIYLQLDTLQEEELSNLNKVLNREFAASTLAGTTTLTGMLPGEDSAQVRKSFLKLIGLEADTANNTMVKILVSLGDFNEDSLLYYRQIITEVQPQLRIIRSNDFLLNDLLFLVGEIPEVPKDSLENLKKLLPPIQKASYNDIPLELDAKLTNIYKLAIRIPVNQRKVSIEITPEEVHISGKPHSIQQSSLDVLKAISESKKLPPVTIPLFDHPYQGILPILYSSEDYSLQMLPSLLRAEFDPVISNSWTTVKSYDKFLRNPLSDEQLRGAGLALTRKLNDPWYDDMTIVQMLRQWQQDMMAYRSELQSWRDQMFPELKLAKEFKEYQTKVASLKDIIIKTKLHFDLPQNALHATAFDVLSKILSDDIFAGQLTEGRASIVHQGNIEIYAVEERLIELHRKLINELPRKRKGSPFTVYMSKKHEIDNLDAVLYQINDLELLFIDLESQLFLLDRNTASQEVQALRSISPIVQITESLSHIMYCLQDAGPKGGWLDKDQLNDVFVNEEMTPIFMGLLSQQLEQVKAKGNFAVNGLMNLVKLTVQDLEYVAVKEITKDSIDLRSSRKAAFINLTLNRLLELPLFIDPQKPDKTHSLIRLYPELGPIPDLSDQALEFIQYTNIRDHRHAMSSLIRLFTQIIDVIEERRLAAANKPKPIAAKGVAVKAKPLTAEQILSKEKGKRKTTKALAFLKKYGDFMANMIDADSSKQVQALLDDIADRPGGSRFKRKEPFTANINGYVGGLIGRETLKGKALTKKEQFASFAPTIPVGLSFSKMTGKGKKAQSFSLFLSILDLGSLTTFSFDSEIEGENQFSFKNIVKPGLQLHWNIKNSPFFLGVGSQWGPQFREFNGEQKQLNSARIFFNFGVDVVIKQLY